MTKTEKTTEKEIFSTRDLYLASTLVTLRFYMVGIDFQIEGEARRPVGYFNFEKTEELVGASKKYLQGQLAIEPRAFITNLKSLKSEVNSYYKSPHSEFVKGDK